MTVVVEAVVVPDLPGLPFEREEYIVVEIRHGVARTDIVHLPARRVLESGRGGPTFDRFEFPPASWPSACRELSSGWIYVRAGLLAGAPVCAACMELLA